MQKTVLFLLLIPFIALAQPGLVSEHLKIDQFGYPPAAKKICVISDPQIGFDAGQNYVPGDTLEVREINTNVLVFQGPATTWNAGATYDQSGDKLWWFDFSDLSNPGEYYIYDPANHRSSFQFEIRTDIYSELLKTAMRVFFYQRSGFAKDSIFAGAWWDEASHLGALQDLDCRLASNPQPGNAKSLEGGWFDAGDFNKYVNFAYAPVHDLIFAYLQRPGIWTDDYNIPESGNGIPDILDELRWELDWLRRMQESDGSVLMKVAVPQWQSASPPSADTAPRRYGPAQASSTRTAASMFAMAAIAYAHAGLNSYADSLELAALEAWNWLLANPGNSNYDNGGFTSANPELSAYRQFTAQVGAAVALFALTGETIYRDYVDSNYAQIQPILWTSWYPFESTIQDLLLYYASLPGATLSVKNAIQNSFKSSMINSGQLMAAVNGEFCGYRAYLYAHENGWGSNSTRCHIGSMFNNIVQYNLESDTSDYLDAALGYLNFLHGVNPLNQVMLSNMYALGAEKSANEIYHGWFDHGTDYDNALSSPIGPAPGYLVGGFNQYFQPDPAHGASISPPQFQPPLKSYKDWNTGWPENSWEVTEPSISYQGAYVKLLSRFVQNPPCDLLVTSTADNGIGSLRAVIECASNNDTISILISPGDTIEVNTIPLEFNKSLVLQSASGLPVVVKSALNTPGVIIESSADITFINMVLICADQIVVDVQGSAVFVDTYLQQTQSSALPALRNQGSVNFKGDSFIQR